MQSNGKSRILREPRYVIDVPFNIVAIGATPSIAAMSHGSFPTPSRWISPALTIRFTRSSRTASIVAFARWVRCQRRRLKEKRWDSFSNRERVNRC